MSQDNTGSLQHLADQAGAIDQHEDVAESKIATLLGYPGAVSANVQLILGNDTNDSSSVGAGIATGASLTLAKRQRHARQLAEVARSAALDARAFCAGAHKLLAWSSPTPLRDSATCSAQYINT